jgi:hypothetical protein
VSSLPAQADVDVAAEAAAGAAPKKRTFRKYSYRGVDIDALLDMSTDDLVQLFPARARRRYLTKAAAILSSPHCDLHFLVVRWSGPDLV